MDNYSLFLESTTDSDNYLIKDVKPDGDCGFRSIALNLNLYNLNLIELIDNEEFNKINSLDFNFKLHKELKKWDGWEYNGNKIESVSKKLRNICVSFIIQNWNNSVLDENLSGSKCFNSLGEYTLNYHEIMNPEEYKEEYLDNLNQNGWIGNPEFYALSKILGVTINIYGLFRYFKNKDKTMMVKLYKNGKVPINTRFKLINVIGSKFKDLKYSINILYEYDTKGLNHYLFLKKKEKLKK
jgi:hypothetical protein